MTKPTDPYSRVYWKVRSDDRFVGIYSDDHHFATWVRLLIAAEAAWPEPADIPAAARRPSLRALADAGIIVLLESGLFRVHGLDAERMRRQERATTAASARWMLPGPVSSADGMQAHPVSNADGMQAHPEGMPRARPELSRAELSRAEQSNGGAPDDAAVAFHLRTGEFPAGRMLAWINDLATEHGEARLAERISVTPMNGHTAPAYLRAVRDELRAEDHAAEKAERVDETARVKEKRRPLTVRRPPDDVTDEEAERIAREWIAAEKAERVDAGIKP